MTAVPEMRFLVGCLPSTQGTSYAPFEALLPLDWDRLLDLVGWHGMFPLFASRLLSSTQGSTIEIPPSVVSVLKSHHVNYLHRSLGQAAALIELQREFDRCGIPVLSWKGPSAGLLLYGLSTLRESGDLDFLLLEKDVQPVLHRMRQLGYRLLSTADSESEDLYLLALHREMTFCRERDQPVVEFHLQILPSRYSRWQDMQADFQRASTTCQLGGVKILMQNPEDLLVSLCAHATKHNWDRLKWSCDIAQFLRVYGDTTDWAPFLDRLRRSRKHLVVLLGLGLVASLFDLPLPPAVRKALQQNPQVGLLVEHVAAHLMSGSLDPIDARHEKSMIALLCPRLRDRIAYRLRPIVELNYVDLYVPVHNRKLFFMNYVFRVVRLLRKYGPYRLVTKTAAFVRSVR